MSEYRITDEDIGASAKYYLNKINAEMGKLNMNIASGQRIHSVSDDPVILDRVFNMKSNSTHIEQFEKNASFAESITQTTSASIDEVNQIFLQVQEITALNTNEISKDNLSAYAEQIDQLLEQSVEALNVRFNGEYLFAGTKADTRPYTVSRDPGTQKITAITYNGNTENAEIAVSNNINVSKFADGQTTTDFTTVINTVLALRNAFDSQDTAVIASMHASFLLPASDKLADAVARIGTSMSRIEFAFQQNEQDKFVVMKNMSNDVSTNLNEAYVDIKQLEGALNAATMTYSRMIGTGRMSLLDFYN